MKEIIEIGGKDYIQGTILMKQWGISYKCLYTWISQEILPRPIKLGRRLLFCKDEVEDRLVSRIG
jgi:predicted DNA-binding transcriptional regulator AlpA